MRTKKSQVNNKAFTSIEEIVRATGRCWRTVKNRLLEANCLPLEPDFDRGDILILFDDSPEPKYTEAELEQIRQRCQALLAKELAREKRARRASKQKGAQS